MASAGAIAVAAGPLIGGAVTTYLTWRLVFAGEVVIVIAILAVTRRINDVETRAAPTIDGVGVLLSASGLGIAVYGVLRSGEWGWVLGKPDAPSLLGISLTLWMVLLGLVILRLFVAWEQHRTASGKEPLVDLTMLREPQLAGGLTMFFFQFLLQAGLFFTIPLFLSVSLGLSAVETGVRLLPLSITLLLAAVGIPRLWPHASPRRVVTWGLAAILLGIVSLVGALEIGAGAEVVTVPLLLAGLGVGALASQLGAVTVSSVPDSLSGEVGGLQNTSTNLGASLGTALSGSVLIAALSASFLSGIEENPAVPTKVSQAAQVELSGGAPFISDADLAQALEDTDLSPAQADALVEENESARIAALRLSIALLGLLAAIALFLTRLLPTHPVGKEPEAATPETEETTT